jgi:hypothetical protein
MSDDENRPMTENAKGKDDDGTPPEDLMRYDLLVEEALRSVVRFALLRARREGLPGDHHFYIAFDTRHPGVRIAERLHEKYPEEMTIVLQHQFWDLKVGRDKFEVGLSFNGIPEKLTIPFEAVTGFFDPHVQFALQFRKDADHDEEEQAMLQAMRGGEESAAEAANAPAEKKKAADKGNEATAEKAGGEKPEQEKVVSLDAFRKKT